MSDSIVPIIIVYLAIISLITIITTCRDKSISKNTGKRRIPEKTLILLAVFGGSFAEYFTMKAIRHKTLHKKFMVGLPFIMILQISLVAVLFIFK